MKIYRTEHPANPTRGLKLEINEWCNLPNPWDDGIDAPEHHDWNCGATSFAQFLIWFPTHVWDRIKARKMRMSILEVENSSVQTGGHQAIFPRHQARLIGYICPDSGKEIILESNHD